VLVEVAAMLVEAAVAVLVGQGRNNDRAMGVLASRVVTGAPAVPVEAVAVGRSSGQRGRASDGGGDAVLRRSSRRESRGDFSVGQRGVSGAGELRIAGGFFEMFSGMNSARLSCEGRFELHNRARLRGCFRMRWAVPRWPDPTYQTTKSKKSWDELGKSEYT
jgi:hypothetical protein